MNAPTDLRMDKTQFFAWGELQEERYELANGRIVVLPFVTRNHERVVTNLVIALGQHLDRTRFDVAHGDFAVETGDRSIRYADVMVEPFDPDGSARSTTNALLLVEVLSPSTMHVDFGEKLEEYKSLPALGTYLICAQNEMRAWVWTRRDGDWPGAPEILEGQDAAVAVPALGIDLSLADIYRNIAVR